MTMFKRAMLYLGLGPDDEYDDDEVEERRPVPAGRVTPSPEPEHDEPRAAVRPLPRERPAPAEPLAAAPAPRRPSVVRPIAAPVSSSKPHAVSPTSFNDAQEVADTFMAATPVIMNLEGVERELSRRLVDFASGLCYGLRGQMEKVTTSVYLLTPSNVEVSAEDRRRLQHGGG